MPTVVNKLGKISGINVLDKYVSFLSQTGACFLWVYLTPVEACQAGLQAPRDMSLHSGIHCWLYSQQLLLDVLLVWNKRVRWDDEHVIKLNCPNYDQYLCNSNQVTNIV